MRLGLSTIFVRADLRLQAGKVAGRVAIAQRASPPRSSSENLGEA